MFKEINPKSLKNRQLHIITKLDICCIAVDVDNALVRNVVLQKSTEAWKKDNIVQMLPIQGSKSAPKQETAKQYCVNMHISEVISKTITLKKTYIPK